MDKRGYPRRQRDGHHLQHAARQRPDLVLRRQQLPDGQRALPVRPAVLEQRQHPHARGDAQLLPAQDVSGEPALPARRHQLAGRPIDLARITVPAYFLSTREDHIAPWKSTYRGTQLLAGENRFVLAASGHIAGVVNPPEGGKYSHWINRDLPPDPETWLAGATEMAGSWWPDWQRWILAHDSERGPRPRARRRRPPADRAGPRQLRQSEGELSGFPLRRVGDRPVSRVPGTKSLHAASTRSPSAGRGRFASVPAAPCRAVNTRRAQRRSAAAWSPAAKMLSPARVSRSTSCDGAPGATPVAVRTCSRSRQQLLFVSALDVRPARAVGPRRPGSPSTRPPAPPRPAARRWSPASVNADCERRPRAA